MVWNRIFRGFSSCARPALRYAVPPPRLFLDQVMSIRYNPTLAPSTATLTTDAKIDALLATVTKLQHTINDALIQKGTLASMMQAVTDQFEHRNAQLTWLEMAIESMRVSQSSELFYAAGAYNLLSASHQDNSPLAASNMHAFTAIVQAPVSGAFGASLGAGAADLISRDSLSSFNKPTQLHNAVFFVLRTMADHDGLPVGLSLLRQSASDADVDIMSEHIARILRGDYTARYEVAGVFLYPLALQAKYLVAKLFLAAYPTILT